MCDLVPVKMPEEEILNAEPDAIIEASRAMHEVNTELIKEFTEKEKEEIEVFELEKQAMAPKGVEFDISMILEGKTFTFRIDKEGIKIEEVEEKYKFLTQECIDEQQRALDIMKIFNRCFKKEGCINE